MILLVTMMYYYQIEVGWIRTTYIVIQCLDQSQSLCRKLGSSVVDQIHIDCSPGVHNIHIQVEWNKSLRSLVNNLLRNNVFLKPRQPPEHPKRIYNYSSLCDKLFRCIRRNPIIQAITKTTLPHWYFLINSTYVGRHFQFTPLYCACIDIVQNIIFIFMSSLWICSNFRVAVLTLYYIPRSATC